MTRTSRVHKRACGGGTLSWDCAAHPRPDQTFTHEQCRDFDRNVGNITWMMRKKCRFPNWSLCIHNAVRLCVPCCATCTHMFALIWQQMGWSGSQSQPLLNARHAWRRHAAGKCNWAHYRATSPVVIPLLLPRSNPVWQRLDCFFGVSWLARALGWCERKVTRSRTRLWAQQPHALSCKNAFNVLVNMNIYTGGREAWI